MNKKDIFEELQCRVLQKIDDLKRLIDDLRSSNSETKSSMGDKYETSREMLAQEINHLQNQLKVQYDFQNTLSKITSDPCNSVQNGALVQTDKGKFYISVGLGEIQNSDQKVFAVSADAPLVKAMWNLEVGNEFVFNSISQKILDVK